MFLTITLFFIIRLIAISFSTVNPTTNTIDEVYDVDVDYGAYFDADPARGPDQTATMGRRRAILISNSPGFRNWTWDRDHKVHFVCHSQGGNTVRYLISLMSRGAGNLHLKYFSQEGRDDWTISVTTLGTPHRGTTIINALENFLSVCVSTPNPTQHLSSSAGEYYVSSKLTENCSGQRTRQSSFSQDSSLQHPSILLRRGLTIFNSTTGAFEGMQAKHSRTCLFVWNQNLDLCGNG
jgi:hypothetical protein